MEKSQKKENERMKSKIKSYEVAICIFIVFFKPEEIRCNLERSTETEEKVIEIHR